MDSTGAMDFRSLLRQTVGAPSPPPAAPSVLAPKSITSGGGISTSPPVSLSGAIDDAVIDEILGQLVDPGPRRLLQHGDGLHQHVGVILLALGQQRLQQGDADGAAEVAHHVEQA